MNTHELIGRINSRTHAIEKLLQRHHPVAKGGLYACLNRLGDELPAILTRAIHVVAKVRNDAIHHPDQFKPTSVPPDFDRLCDEIEQLIPYFANQRPAQPVPPTKKSPKKAKPPAPQPQT
jgi:hypothetical protein